MLVADLYLGGLQEAAGDGQVGQLGGGDRLPDRGGGTGQGGGAAGSDCAAATAARVSGPLRFPGARRSGRTR
jgi:hypothetical protein